MLYKQNEQHFNCFAFVIITELNLFINYNEFLERKKLLFIFFFMMMFYFHFNLDTK